MTAAELGTAGVGLALWVAGGLLLLGVLALVARALYEGITDELNGYMHPGFGDADPDDPDTWNLAEWRDEVREAMRPHEWAREQTQRMTGGAS